MGTVHWGVDRGKVDPQVAADFEAMCAPLPFDVAAVYGWRSNATQTALFAKYQAGGPQADPPGHSPHEFCLPDGTPNSEAVDVAIILPDGKTLDWSYVIKPEGTLDEQRTSGSWMMLIRAVRASARLHSGADFPPVAPADPDHIQSVAWPGVRAKLEAAGNWPMHWPSPPIQAAA